MTKRIEELKTYFSGKNHHHFRTDLKQSGLVLFAEDSPQIRAAKRFKWILSNENPVIHEKEEILFTRTTFGYPDIHTGEEWKVIRSNHFIPERGSVFNICPDYEGLLRNGLEAKRLQALRLEYEHPEKYDFYHSIVISIDSVLDLTRRYCDEAVRIGKTEAARALEAILSHGAENFREALQLLRIIHFSLWCAGNYHLVLGRFDQYLWPYLQKDLNNKVLKYEEAFELVEEFFLACNRDSDLYIGMQRGDNGQSMVLGGVDKNGAIACNLLTEMCLRASLELCLIDPKINLRVDKNTPDALYQLGTQLSRKGLGFPQYLNDDVIIKGMSELGYMLEDARDYTVAACWEVITQGVGFDVVNIAAVNLARLAHDTIINDLPECINFEQLFESFCKRLRQNVLETANTVHDPYFEPAPLMSSVICGCIESGIDISYGSQKYNNFGLHGTGIATAVDSLAAVCHYVYRTKKITAERMLAGLKTCFENDEQLFAMLRFEAPKIGFDNDEADRILVDVIDTFSQSVKGIRNSRGGIYRAGTGSAMYYITHGDELCATADGRTAGSPLPANYSPSLHAKVKGPISIIRSFTKPELSGVINGGPLTLEFHTSVFKNDESISKVAQVIKHYIDLGGHQVQLNVVDREKLLKAQKEPDKYKNLIVRVWGWSGYFVELDKVYQDHIIKRAELIF